MKRRTWGVICPCGKTYWFTFWLLRNAVKQMEKAQLRHKMRCRNDG